MSGRRKENESTSLRFRLCRQRSDEEPRCLGDAWYRTCLECLVDLDHHAEHHGNLHEAFAPWCELCAAAGEALNDDAQEQLDNGDRLNGPRFR
jgi:hypothetical protein